MNRAELRAAFRAHIGEEEFRRFYEKLQVPAPGEYQTRYWQEQLVDDFIRSTKDNLLTTSQVIEAVSDRTRYVYACPSTACTFFAACENSDPDNKPDGQWFCPECSQVWEDTEQLFASIREAIAKHPHRAYCYVIEDQNIVPTSCSSWPDNHIEACESEWGD